MREAAASIVVGDMEFDNPIMIRARRMWADALERGRLQDGDDELVKFMQVDPIRDRLAADVVNPYAWDEAEYAAVFLGEVDAENLKVGRLRRATELCIALIELSTEDETAPMIMIMSYIQWLMGQNDLARQGAMLALQSRPDYVLAAIMLSFIQNGIAPRWMSRN